MMKFLESYNAVFSTLSRQDSGDAQIQQAKKDFDAALAELKASGSSPDGFAVANPALGFSSYFATARPTVLQQLVVNSKFPLGNYILKNT